jgi:hypothetical protein
MNLNIYTAAPLTFISISCSDLKPILFLVFFLHGHPISSNQLSQTSITLRKPTDPLEARIYELLLPFRSATPQN